MTDAAKQIGTVTIAHGTTVAEGPDGARELAVGSPVFANDLVKTEGQGSAVEIKFSDGALLSQGPNSSVSLDSYVFDPDQGTGEMAVKLLEGTFRSVTGEIVDLNPEGFKLSTPMATIGIRGTTTGHTVGTGGQEAHVVVDFVDKPVVIRPASGGPVRVVTRDGMSVTASSSGVSTVFAASRSQLSTFQQLSSQSLQQGAPQFDVQAAEQEAKEAAEKAEQETQEAEAAAQEAEAAAQAAAQAEADAATAQAAAEAAAAEAAAAEAAAQAAAEAAAQDAAAQAAAEAAAQAAAEAQAAAQAAAAEAAAQAAAAEAAAAAAAAAEAAAQVQAAEAAQAQAAAQAAAVTVQAQQAASQAAPNQQQQQGQDGDGGQDGGQDGDGGQEGGQDGGDGPGGTGEDPITAPPPPPGVPVTPPDVPTAPVVTGGDGDGEGDGDGDDDDITGGTVDTIVVSELDLSDWGDNLTVDLSASPAYYQTTGDASTRVNLAASDTTYDVGILYGATTYYNGGSPVNPNNILTGDSGDNHIYGGMGGNTLTGHCGDDLMAVGTYNSTTGMFALGMITSDDEFHGGNDSDTLMFDGNVSTTDLDTSTSIEKILLGNSAVNLETQTNLVDAGATLVVDGTLSADVTFWAYNDSDSHFDLVGGLGDDYLKGGQIADTLMGMMGDDCLDGQGGDDSLFGINGGKDELIGGTGDDAFWMGTKLSDGEGTDTITGGTGDDTLYFTDNDYSSGDLDQVSGIENIVLGTTTNVTTLVVGTALADGGKDATINGSALINTMNFDAGAVTSGAFHVIGGIGADVFNGGDGDDTFEGGLGADQLNGQAGANVLSYAGAIDDMIINLSAQTAIGLHATGDVITWASFSGIIGGMGDDAITGDTNNNILQGGAGADTILGSLGDDTFIFNTGDVADGEEFDGQGGDDWVHVETSTDFSGAALNNNIYGLEIMDGQTATFDTGMDGFLTGLTKVSGSAESGTDETILYQGSDNSETMDIADLKSVTFLNWSGNDAVNIDAAGGDDRITYSSAIDSVDGGEGDDTLAVLESMDITGADYTEIEALDIVSSGTEAIVTVAQVDDFAAIEGDGDLNIAQPYGSDGIDLSSLDLTSHNGGVTVNTSDSGGTVNMGGNMSSAITIVGDTSHQDVLTYQDDGIDTNTDELDNVSGIEEIRFQDGESAYVVLDTDLASDTGEVYVDGSNLTGGRHLEFDASVSSAESYEMEGGSCDDVLVGGGLDDTLTGNSGDDELSGGGGDDSIYGGVGADIMMGGAGDDAFYLSANHVEAGEIIYGGDDSTDGGSADMISVLASTDFTSAGIISGIEVLKMSADATVTMESGSAGDFFAGIDVLMGSSGGDTTTVETLLYNGTSGNDVMYLGDVGSISLDSSWKSNDVIKIMGLGGGDTITGFNNDLYYDGGAGDDEINAGHGNNTLIGGAGDDTFSGTASSPNTDDLMDGGVGTDSMDGGYGSDTFVFNTGDVGTGEYIHGGMDTGDIDVISVVTSTDFTEAGTIEQIERVHLAEGTTAQFNDLNYHTTWTVQGVSGSGTEILQLEVDTASGGTIFATNMTFTAFDGDDKVVILGNDGDDYLKGNASTHDSLEGGMGSDHLWSDGGHDTLLGGAGNDTIHVDNTTSSTNLVIDGGADINQVWTDSDVDLSGSTISGISIFGLQGGDDLTFSKAQAHEATFGVEGSGTVIVAGLSSSATTIDLSGLDLGGYSGILELTMSSGNDSLNMGANMSAGDRITQISGGVGYDIISLIDSGSQGALDAVSSVEKIVIEDSVGVTDILLDGSIADSGGLVTIDATALTNTNAVYFDATAGTGNYYEMTGATGADKFTGSGGDDTLYGESGSDTLKGGNGMDSLLGGSDGDSLWGQSGDDYIDGGSGNDTIYGQGDNGTTGHDEIYGGSGDDWIKGDGGTGSSGNDEIYGGSGNDTIWDDAGNDIVEGGSGADRMIGGEGTDTLSYASDTVGVTVNLTTMSASGAGSHADGDTIEDNFEGIFGGSGDDNLTGSTGAESIKGGAGDDVITGAGGQDSLLGEAGDDEVVLDTTAAVGSGVLDGGDDTDTLKLATVGTVDLSAASTVQNFEVVEFTKADGDTFLDLFNYQFDSAWTLNVTAGAAAHVQTLRVAGSSGNEVVDLSGLTFGGNWDLTQDNITVTLAEGADKVIASTTAEKILGGQEQDTVDYSNSTAGVNVNLWQGTVTGGYAANDTLSGIEVIVGASDYSNTLGGSDDGDTELIGGDEGDRFLMNDYLSSGDTLTGGAGRDTLEVTSPGDSDFLDNVTGVEVLLLGDADTNVVGHDSLADAGATMVLDASGLTGTNSLIWDGDSISSFKQDLNGSSQNDSIRGGSGDDTLDGGLGQDSLEGGSGDDSIVGGLNDQDLREMDVAKYANSSGAINANLQTGIVTGAGTDTLDGIEGIWGTTGDDTMVGDSGWANAFIDGGGSDDFDGNSARDTLADTGLDIVSYDYAFGVGLGDTGIIANMTGTSGSVTLGGDVDTLTDIDIVWATDGKDSLVGTSGEQEFMPGTGNDTVEGGDDWDSVSYWNLTAPVYVSWETNHWQVKDHPSDAQTWIDTLTDIEHIEGSAGDDVMVGNSSDNSFSGWDGADDIDGDGGINTVSYEGGTQGVDIALDLGGGTDGWGNSDVLTNIQNLNGSEMGDTLSGTTGSNTLYGNDGNDELDGFGGMDVLDGGYGDDTIFLRDAPSNGTVVRGGDGDETLGDVLQVEGVDMAGVVEATGFEYLTLGESTNTTMAHTVADGQTWELASDTGSTCSLTVTVAAGQSVDMSGWTFGEGFACITISGSDDVGSGEVIVGSSWGETIIGNNGSDNLTGSGGDDTFVWDNIADVLTAGVTGDIITDFTSGTDIIQLGSEFGDLLWYEEDNYDGVIDDASSDADILVWDSANNQLWYDQDGQSSDGRFERVIATTTGANVAMTDVHVVDASISIPVVGQALTGDGGDNTLTGDEGNDTIKGLGGVDILNGEEGHDILMPYGVNDSSTVSTADELYGGSGTDTVKDLADQVDFRNMTLDSIEVIEFGKGSSGSDSQGYTFNAAQLSGGNFTINGDFYTTLTANGTAADDTVNFSTLEASGLASAIQVDLSTGHDLFLGSNGAEYVTGGGGQDTIQGGAGDDTLAGGVLADVFKYQYGNSITLSTNGDTIDDFETGVDRFCFIADIADQDLYWYDLSMIGGTYVSGVLEEGGSTLTGAGFVYDDSDSNDIKLWYDDDFSVSGSEGVVANLGSNTVAQGDLFAEGFKIDDGGGNVVWTGDTGDNSHTGDELGDTLYGFSGDDTLNGNLGDDVLIGGMGDDSLEGGDDLDTASYAYNSGGVTADLTGELFFDSGTGYVFEDYNGSTYQDTLVGVENLQGSGYNDFLFGDNNANRIDGGDGADVLGGIFGNANTYASSGGADTLTGGLGADTFYLHNTTMDAIEIKDFNSGLDKIGLDSNTFSAFGTVSSEVNFCVVNVGAGLYDGTGGNPGTPSLIYASNNTTSGELYYDADGSDAGGHVLLATITEENGMDLDENDFLTLDTSSLGTGMP